MKRVLLAVPLIVASACGTAEDPNVGPTAALHQDAQTPPECRLGDTVCATVVLRDLVGTPNLLQAYFLRRVNNTAIISEVVHIENPNLTANKEYPLVIRNLANEGAFYLAVSLEVSTSRTGNLDADSIRTPPVWTQESIRHIDADNFDINSATRRGNSWFESRDNRLTAPTAVAEAEFDVEHQILAGDRFIDLPNLRGRYDLEYIGWSNVFNLDGNPVNVGIIELQPRLDQDVPFDGHTQFPTP